MPYCNNCGASLPEGVRLCPSCGADIQSQTLPPPPPPMPQPTQEEGKKRGVLLTAWLIFMLIANTGVTIYYFLFGPLIMAMLPTIPSWVIYALGIGALLNVVFTIFLFKWKKWAFFACCGMALFAMVINVAVIRLGITSILGLLGPVILWLLLRSKWNYLE